MHCRPMILLVGAITDQSIELTDGWYSLPCPVQPGDALHRLLVARRICQGTKLVVQGCSLIATGGDGTDQGCHPLDAGAGLQLCVQVNSCRRARWWARLGACPPISVRLDSLVGGGGGLAPLVRVVIARTYPIVYCVQTNGKTEYLR